MSPSESVSRILAVAANTFREAIRMKLFLLLVLVSMGSLLGGFAFRDFNLGASELKFIADFGFGGMTLFGSIAAIVITVQLIYGEIEHRTILPLLAKPVGRVEFLFGKLLGAWLTIACFIFALFTSLVVALLIREGQLAAQFPDEFDQGSLVSYQSVFLYSVLQIFRLVILASAAAFFASYASSSMFAVFMGIFFWTIGQLQGAAQEQMAGSASVWAWMVDAAALAIPDLRVFDLGGDLIGGGGRLVSLAVAAKLIVYALAYTLLYTFGAAAVLRKREL